MRKNGEEKIVCACRDFTEDGCFLEEFASLKNSIVDSPNNGYGTEISEEQNNKFFNQYFLSEFSKERVSITQQTLYNLGFINLINQVFEYISWVVKIKNDFSRELLSLEKILISIYKLLVVFIFDNKKHQYIIREKLYLYLCPLKLKNKSQNILLFIGYFLLNVAYSHIQLTYR